MTDPKILYFQYGDIQKLSDCQCVNLPGLKLSSEWSEPIGIQGNSKEMDFLTQFLERDEWKNWRLHSKTATGLSEARRGKWEFSIIVVYEKDGVERQVPEKQTPDDDDGQNGQ